jgi:Uma2 family endonuclease
LIEGRLVKKPMAGYEHNWIAEVIKYTLYQLDPHRKLGVMLTETSTTIGPKDTPMPDIAFWTAKTRPRQLIKGAAPRPDLVVEIMSPRDLETQKRRADAKAKVKRYQAAGVSLIWLIDPEAKTVEVYHSDQAVPVLVLTVNDQLAGEDVIPGFTLAVAALFEYDLTAEEEE